MLLRAPGGEQFKVPCLGGAMPKKKKEPLLDRLHDLTRRTCATLNEEYGADEASGYAETFKLRHTGHYRIICFGENTFV